MDIGYCNGYIFTDKGINGPWEKTFRCLRKLGQVLHIRTHDHHHHLFEFRMLYALQAILQGLSSSKEAFHLVVWYVDGKIAESTLYSAIRTFLDSYNCSHNNHHAYCSWGNSSSTVALRHTKLLLLILSVLV